MSENEHCYGKFLTAGVRYIRT